MITRNKSNTKRGLMEENYKKTCCMVQKRSRHENSLSEHANHGEQKESHRRLGLILLLLQRSQVPLKQNGSTVESQRQSDHGPLSQRGVLSLYVLLDRCPRRF